MKKRTINYLTTIGILIIVAFFAPFIKDSYLRWESKHNYLQEINTKKWEKYENKEFGFSFRYPKSATIKENRNNGLDLIISIEDENTYMWIDDNEENKYVKKNNLVSLGPIEGSDEADNIFDKNRESYVGYSGDDPSFLGQVSDFYKNGYYWHIVVPYMENSQRKIKYSDKLEISMTSLKIK